MTTAAQDGLFAPPREPVWCPRCPECLQRRRRAAGRSPLPRVTPLELFAARTCTCPPCRRSAWRSCASAPRQPRLFQPTR
jgi:hypothetical protein